MRGTRWSYWMLGKEWNIYSWFQKINQTIQDHLSALQRQQSCLKTGSIYQKSILATTIHSQNSLLWACLYSNSLQVVPYCLHYQNSHPLLRPSPENLVQLYFDWVLDILLYGIEKHTIQGKNTNWSISHHHITTDNKQIPYLLHLCISTVHFVLNNLVE